MTPNEILNKQFSKSTIGGYRTEEVHAFLAEISDYIKEINHDRSDLERKMVFLAEKIEEYRADEESLRAALVSAQKTGETIIQNAKEEADKITAVAKKQADTLLSEAKESSEAMTKSAKLKVDTEAYTLNRMQMEVSKFRGQILNMYEKQMELINAIPFDTKEGTKPLPRPAGLDGSVMNESALGIGEKQATEVLDSFSKDSSASQNTPTSPQEDEGFQLNE